MTTQGVTIIWIRQLTKGQILCELERVKWFLWHGNVFRADETPSDLIDEVEGAREEDREAGRPARSS
jgi:hypothetical protein